MEPEDHCVRFRPELAAELKGSSISMLCLVLRLLSPVQKHIRDTSHAIEPRAPWGCYEDARELLGTLATRMRALWVQAHMDTAKSL